MKYYVVCNETFAERYRRKSLKNLEMFNVPVDKPKGGAPGQKKDIYIDSLPSSYTASDFAELFASFKTTSLNFKKHKTGSQTGFGFVSLETAEEAQRAIRELNGKKIQDQVTQTLLMLPT